MYETHRCSARRSMNKKNLSLPLTANARASTPVNIEKRDCERVSPAMLLTGGGRRCERDEILADPDFDFSKAPVGVPWIDESERDGSSCCEVVKKVQGSLGRVTESAVTSADGTADSAALPVLPERLRDRGGLAITASTITVSKVIRPGRVK